MTPPRLVVLVLICAAVLLPFTLVSRGAYAGDPLDPKAVPDPLRPWTAWVLDGKSDALCPAFYGHAEQSRCAWPARLELVLEDHGGRFSQNWHIDAKRWVPLPGDAKRWPSDVRVDAARGIVDAQADLPSVQIAPGCCFGSGSPR